MGDTFSFNAEYVVADDEWISTRLSVEIAPDGDLVPVEEMFDDATVCYKGFVCNVVYRAGKVMEVTPLRHQTEERDVWKDLRLLNEHGSPTAKLSTLGKEFADRAEELLTLMLNDRKAHLLRHKEVLKRTIAKYQLRLAAVEQALEKLDE